jgi:hypothetical protein
MSCLWQQHADLLIEPDVSAYAFDDFQKALNLVKIGEEAGRKALPTFRAWAAERTAYEKYLHEAGSRKISVATAPAIVQQPLALG